MRPEVDEQLLVLKMKKIQFQQNLSEIFFSLSKLKAVHLHVFNFSTISQILKTNYKYFGLKLVETDPSCSHELVTFLKYHMPLNLSLTL